MQADPRLPDDSVNVSDTHPLSEAFTLIAGIVVIGVITFALGAMFVDMAAPRVPLQTEAKVFGSLWGTLGNEDIGLGPITSSPELTSLVARLARHWDENPYDYRVGILEQDAPNALALPGGIILVSTGLLDMMESENELAFVLGHEIGHFHNRDHLKGLGRGALFSMLTGFVRGGSGDVIGYTRQLSNNSYGRRDETNADHFGLDLVYKEYGHVSGSSDFFEKLALTESQADKTYARYAGTHPVTDDRVKNLRGYAVTQGWSVDEPLLPRLEVSY